MDRSRAHLAIVTHLPARDWRWLGLRLRCTFCGQRFPCPPHRRAIDILAAPYGGPPEPGRPSVPDRRTTDPSGRPTEHRHDRPPDP